MATLKGPVTAPAWYSSQPMDGGIGPGFAVNVGAGGVGGAARPATGRTGAQVRGAGQLRIEADVVRAAGRQRRRATVVQGAGGVVIGPDRRGVEIDDAVVERAPIRPASARRPSCRSACSCSACPTRSDARIVGEAAVVERPAGRPTARIAGQGAVVQRAPNSLRRRNCRSSGSCSACPQMPRSPSCPSACSCSACSQMPRRPSCPSACSCSACPQIAPPPELPVSVQLFSVHSGP